MPYSSSDTLETQIRTSVASSLRNLRPTEDTEDGSYIDCLLLHSPLPTIEETLEAWRVLESYVPHKLRALGISNVTLPIVKTIFQSSKIKPSVVQNRFYPATRYDVSLRSFCKDNGISYQSFWTLTGNPKLLKSKPVTFVAKTAEVEIPVALYALVMDLGIVVLNGTTSMEHMQEDLAGIQKVRNWAADNTQHWDLNRKQFAEIVNAFAH
jgi:diketogulonate reductase-like aldo/keto reductase